MSDPSATNPQIVTPALSLQARAFLDSVEERPGIQDRSVHELRDEASVFARKFSGVPEPVASIQDLDSDGVRARLYRPEQDNGDVLVWFHGGAWMLGGIDDHDALSCAIVNRAACSVLSVDYRLAPEHPYPAAIDDSWAAIEWAAREFGAVAVGGDSSGGNLAAAVALRARDRGVELALELLVYPALDAELTFVKEFAARYGEQYFEGLRHVWDVYVPDPKDRNDVDVSPLRASSLSGLPPTLIILAEHDPLCEEGEEYFRRLKEDGVPVDMHLYAGQIHGFYSYLAVFDDAWDAVRRTASALRVAFNREDAPKGTNESSV
jgi:acetyl esterase